LVSNNGLIFNKKYNQIFSAYDPQCAIELFGFEAFNVVEKPKIYFGD